MKKLMIIPILLAGTATAWAGGTFDSGGVSTGTHGADVHMIGEHHMVIQVNNTYDAMTPNDPASPTAGMGGSCFGNVEIIGRSASGSGNCVFSDDSGNAMSNHWTITGIGADRAIMGTWVATGGAGTLAGVSGGGTFSSTTDQATGRFRNETTGAITIP